MVFMAENPWFVQIIFGKAGEPKLNALLCLLLFGRGFQSFSPFIAIVPLQLHQNASRRVETPFCQTPCIHKSCRPCINSVTI